MERDDKFRIAGCLAMVLVPLLGGGYFIDGCMHEHSRPPGHGNLTIDVSPNGKQIVFAGEGRGGRDLYLLDLATRKVTALTRSRDYEICAAFSPDGTLVAFTRGGPRERADQLCVLDLGTGQTMQLTSEDANISSPSFSSDGREILYTRDTHYRWGGLASNWDEAGEVWSVDLATGRRKRLLPDIALASYALKLSDRILVDAGSILVAPANGSEKTLVPQGTLSDVSWKTRTVLFTSGQYIKDTVPYTVPLDGGEPKRIPGSPGACFSPRFSPDGRTVYFLKEVWPDGATGEPVRELWQIPSAGGQPQRLAGSELFSNPLGR